MRKGERLGSMSSFWRSALTRRSTPASTEADIAPSLEGAGVLAEEATEFCVSCARRRLADAEAVWAAGNSAMAHAINSVRTVQSTSRTAARIGQSWVIWLFLLAALVVHYRSVNVEQRVVVFFGGEVL